MFFFFQAEDGIRDLTVTGVQTCALPILTQVSDPMSGFFTVRASSLELANLRPLGYKILLELLVRNRPGRVIEVPYAFQDRHAGASKSTVAEGWRFLRHLATLRFGGTRLRSGLEAA